MTTSTIFSRVGRAAGASGAVACALAVLAGGAATAAPATGPDLPDWYTLSHITTKNCAAPIAVDHSRVQLTCRTKFSAPVSITNPPAGERSTILHADVRVPANGRTVRVDTFDSDGVAPLTPRESKSISPKHSATFKIDDRFDEDADAWIGSTMVVRAPLIGSDIVVTIYRG